MHISDWSSDVCSSDLVEEGLNQAPRFVRVEPKDGRVQAIAPLSAAHDSIAPLRVTPHQWTNRLGYRSTGFIVWPRNYQTSSRYPAIIITHGSDADERRSEEHTSELQSLMRISYAVFCLKNKNDNRRN